MNKYILDETEPANTHLNYPVEPPQKKKKCHTGATVGSETMGELVDDLRLRLECLEDFVYQLVNEDTCEQEDSMEDTSEQEDL